MANTVHEQSVLRNFRFYTKEVDWKDFITAGCYYKLLDVNVGARTADMIVKFDPGARCMYHRHVAPCTSLVLEGELRVRILIDNKETCLVTLSPGEFFGEMGLLIGGDRSASVIALSDCACYRLDKHDFVDILVRRPEIAEDIARTLAKRRGELESAREGLNEQARRDRERNAHGDLLHRIRRFFNVES